jgi:hypothetical protein
MRFKKLLSLLLFVLGLLSCAFGQTKRALIFAIGKYPDDSGWTEISSSRDDSLIKRALAEQKFSDIRNISDKEATIAGIKKALDELISRSQPGDIVVIHISSHGERIEDLGGNKPDGLEESIVSYEGKLPAYGSEPTAEEVSKLKQGYFRDDEFGRYVDKLRVKLGPKGDVMVLLDLCYAGTGTRGTAKIRGGRPPLVSPGFSNKQHNLTPDNKQDFLLPEESAMASYVVIGAAGANEADNEMKDDNGQPVGPLSFAVSKVFAGLDAGMTYRSLFAKIKSVMNEKQPGQHPVLIGNGRDRTLFGGQFIAQKPYVSINHIEGKRMSLNAGKFAGIDSGAKVAVYPAGTINPLNGKRLATGTVISSGLYNAEVQLDNDPGIKKAALGWVFINSQVFKNSRVNISLTNNAAGLKHNKQQTAFSFSEAESIRAALRNIREVQLSNNPDINIARGIHSNVDSIIISSTGKLFDTLTNASKDTVALLTKIRAYVRYKFLKSINITNPDYDLVVKLLPVINGKPDTTFINKETPSFKAGDKLMIWVNNVSRKNLFINILDMQPDGVINPILPNRTQRIFADDLLVPSGSSYLFRNYVITIEPPYGNEIFKIFASTDKIDLEDIATSHGEARRGNLRPFEALVQRSFNLRGQPSQSVANSDGASYNLYFDIVPAN